MTINKRILSGWMVGIMALLWGQTAAAAPQIDHWQSSQGAQVYWVESSQLPMVDMQILWAAGGAYDGGKAGLAQLTSALLMTGAGNLSVEQIATELEKVGAELTTEAERDSATVSLRSLTQADWLNPALAVMNQVLTRPSFPQADFERVRQQMLVALQQQEQSPEDIASKAWYQAVYGQHPYGSPPDGTKASVSALTLEEVRAFYHRYYVANNAIVIIVGAVKRTQAEAMVEQVLQGLPAGVAAPPIPPVPPLTEAKTIRIDYPSTQTHILVGQPGMARLDPDYFALYVGNHILGGSGLVSRLSQSIREQRGLSYSVYSYFAPMQSQGPFIMGLQTSSAQTEQALALLQQELVQFMATGATPTELLASQRNIVGSIALNLDSNRKIANYLAALIFYRLPLDYLATLSHNIEQVTLTQIQQAWQRHIQPQQQVTVIVGQPADKKDSATVVAP